MNFFHNFFSRHMKIERTAVTFGLAVFAMTVLLIYEQGVIHARNKKVESNEAVLLSTTSTSLTNASFTVDAVYENESRTQAMILLSGDLDSVSYAADSYSIYAVGKHTDSMSGGIYVFGELGKLCIFVTDIGGFSSEQTTFVVRCDRPTGTIGEVAAQYKDSGQSYMENDQMDVIVNLGAAEVIPAPFLKDDGVNIEAMAEAAFSHADDAAVREELLVLQKASVDAAKQLASVRSALAGLGVQTPVMPDWAASDEIGERKHSGNTYIKSEYVVKGYADFDWENTKRTDNYEKKAKVNVEDLVTADEPPAEITETTKALSEGTAKWYHEDGSVIKEPTVSEASTMTQYDDALLAYYQAKCAYQAKVTQLILTQNGYLSSVQDYTSNVGPGVITGIN